MKRELHDAIVRTIKGLTIDAVEAANSGHPGLPMGMADAATVLWTLFLRHDPARPDWADRDRFVLSAGHGSMLLYSLLHLTGYDLGLDDLKQFRQLGSRTAGHPEYGHAPGVETTTGPLGQGFANGVGMAIAERHLAARYNRDGHTIVGHHIYAIVSDGDVMEGVASEAASLAGHLGLGNLIYLYDDNSITIDGPTDLAFSEDVPKRFDAYGWHTQTVDGHDPVAVAAAITAAQQVTDRPSLIACKTVIGAGSPTYEGKSDIHSDAVGAEEIQRIRERIGLPLDQDFYVAGEVTAYFKQDRARLTALSTAWDEALDAWRADAGEALSAEWDAVWSRALPADLAECLPTWEVGKALATRNASGEVLQVLADKLPALIGGSADLTPSNKTAIKGSGPFAKGSFGGRNVSYGVREHAMAAAMNGMALHGALRPYAGTFLTFADYMRPSIRLAALMGQPVSFVFTHDSIFVGEDGPTHQPVEQIMSLRAIPGLHVDRPADATETAAAWLAAMQRTDGPTAFAFTRQKLPTLAGSSIEGALKGGYVVADCEGTPDVLLLGTGSELQLCVGAAEALGAEGVKARVVSMPCWGRFETQPKAYRDDVLPPAVTARVSAEAGVSLGWERYTGLAGGAVSQETFGASAPWQALAEHFGFTVAAVTAKAREVLSR